MCEGATEAGKKMTRQDLRDQYLNILQGWEEFLVPPAVVEKLKIMEYWGEHSKGFLPQYWEKLGL